MSVQTTPAFFLVLLSIVWLESYMSVEGRRGMRVLASARALVSGHFGGARASKIFAITRLQDLLRSPPLETKHPEQIVE